MLDSISIGDLKNIIAAISPQQAPQAQHPFVGRYVICRASGAGVHAGVLTGAVCRGDSYEVVLGSSRRLWSWTARAGVALSGLAVHGLKSGKVDALIEQISITGVVEIVPCSVTSRESIDAA